MTRQAVAAAAAMSPGAESQIVARLAREASVEIDAQVVSYLERSRTFLVPGVGPCVSRLPRQARVDTPDAGGAARATGHDPVFQVPVQLIPDASAIAQVPAGAARVTSVARARHAATQSEALAGRIFGLPTPR